MWVVHITSLKSLSNQQKISVHMYSKKKTLMIKTEQKYWNYWGIKLLRFLKINFKLSKHSLILFLKYLKIKNLLKIIFEHNLSNFIIGFCRDTDKYDENIIVMH